MKLRKFIALASSVAATSVMMMTLAAPAARADNQTLSLIWSDSSGALNQSTRALAAGHSADAVRHAKTALGGPLSYGDRIIAAHNLCIALVQDQPEAALPRCRTALEAPSRMVVKQVGTELKIR
ncbi:MAG: hypothetical protein RLN70_02295, partial [Rhodospirillaceae bacterium]